MVAGSSRYPGAAVMAAKAAARAGAGYVTLAVPVTIAPLSRCSSRGAGRRRRSRAGWHILRSSTPGDPAGSQSAALPRSSGPGMRVTGGTVAVVSALINSKAPLVVDADGLNCLARLTNGHLDEFPEVTARRPACAHATAASSDASSALPIRRLTR